MSIIVVGADLSLAATALVATRHNVIAAGFEVLASRRMKTDLRGIERLNEIDLWCQRFLDDLEFRGLHPRLVLFEGPGFGSQVAHALGQLHGVVKVGIWRRRGGFRMGDIPPSTLKKFVTGSGASDKNVVMKGVFKRWGFDSDDDNECDAFAASMAGQCLCGDEEGTKAQRQALTGKVTFYESRGGPLETPSAVVGPRDESGSMAGRFRRRRVG
jgi:crossover junction endodeoxyribonuclease RuvC